MKKKKILFLYSGLHYNHRAFGEGIGADLLAVDHRFAWVRRRNLLRRLLGMIISVFTIPAGYDVIVTESYYPFAVLAKKLGILPRQVIIINLAMDPSYYNLYFHRIPFPARQFLLYLMKDVDGFLSGGTMVEDLITRLIGKRPFGFFPNFIKEDTGRAFLQIEPDLDSRHILFIGIGDDDFYKGLDLLADTLRLVREDMPDAELMIIGPWHGKLQQKYAGPGVHFLGRQDLAGAGADIVRQCALALHPGRGDTFPVVTLEVMAAGLPCIVSEWTGTKDVMEKIRPDLVQPLDAGQLAERVKAYFRMPAAEREALSRQVRQVARDYLESRKSQSFSACMDELLEQIGEGR